MADPAIHDPLKVDFEVPTFNTQSVEPYQAPAQVPQSSVLAGTAMQAQSAQVQAMNARGEASVSQGVDAAIDEMSPMARWRWWNAPDFAPQQDFSVGSRIQELDITLSGDDRAFLLQSKSDDEFDYRLSNLERSRRNFQAIGENPWTATPLMMLDPEYLAVDVLSLGAGRLAAAARLGKGMQRAAAGATAGIGAIGITATAAQSRPVSTGEFVTNALLNAGATSLVYRAGKLQPRDPEYPGATINNIANDMQRSEPHAPSLREDDPFAVRNPDARTGAPTHSVEAPDLDSPTNARVLAEDVAATYRGTEVDELAQAILRAPELDAIRVTTSDVFKALSPRARGFIATAKEGTTDITGPEWTRGPFKAIYVAPRGDADVALHELTHAVIQTRVHAPEFKHIKSELHAIRQNLVQELSKGAFSKSTKIDNGLSEGNKTFLRQMMSEDFNEFIAYGLSSPAFRHWAKATALDSTGAAPAIQGFSAAPKPLTVWDKFMDLVSQLLGAGRPRLEKFLEGAEKNAAYMERRPAAYKTLDTRLNEIVDELTVGGRPTDMFNDGVMPVTVLKNTEDLGKRILDNEDRTAVKLGKKISWSLHKTLSQFGPVSKRIADTLVDDPINMTHDSVVSQTRAIRADLAAEQYVFEDLLKAEMAKVGAGLRQQVFNPGKALEAQRAIERRVLREMHGREQAARQGLKWNSNETPEIRKMADALDRSNAAALAEMKAAGVSGAEEVTGGTGWFTRRWDNDSIERLDAALMRTGLDAKQANRRIVRMVSTSLRRANGWEDELATDVAQAIIDRARRKGYFEDTQFRGHAGNETLAEIRDMLRSQGISAERQQRVLDLLAGKVDEAGKAPFLKHRVDLDYKVGIMADGETFTVSDLLGGDITRMQEQYLDRVAGQSALARKGLGDVSALGSMRSELAHSIPNEARRKEAVDLFDQTVNSIMGRPVGEDMPALLRASQAATRMVGLASSGLWQITEFAPAMARYGALKALRYMAQEMPGFGKLMKNATNDGSTATQLHSILTRNSSADIRMRPFVQRLEDNFDIPAGSRVQLALQQAQQLVPYLNAQKFVQSKQASMVANLVIDSLAKAGRGDVRALAAWEQYGLKVHTIERLTDAVKKHGTDTSLWPDSLWREVRGPITKAMDDSVLRNRTGEIPAFAQFSQVGKFIFTFRSFVLGAHNKVLAGTMGREGFAGLGLLMLYQMPLSMLATAANSTLQGKEIKDEKELVAKSFGQMGSFGLFSDLFGVISGEKQQFGAPGLILADRLYKTVGAAAQGNFGAAAESAISATPVLSIIPGIRGFANLLPDGKE